MFKATKIIYLLGISINTNERASDKALNYLLTRCALYTFVG